MKDPEVCCDENGQDVQTRRHRASNKKMGELHIVDPRKDGWLCFCVGYRKSSAITVRFSYPSENMRRPRSIATVVSSNPQECHLGTEKPPPLFRKPWTLFFRLFAESRPCILRRHRSFRKPLKTICHTCGKL